MAFAAINNSKIRFQSSSSVYQDDIDDEYEERYVLGVDLFPRLTVIVYTPVPVWSNQPKEGEAPYRPIKWDNRCCDEEEAGIMIIEVDDNGNYSDGTFYEGWLP